MKLVRITFSKTGRAGYISHLDLTRCMMRAVRRAGIPLWYTEGFNPHPYMTFALPLPLGVEGECETMDIKLDGERDNQAVLESLSAVMPGDIKITAVSEAGDDPSLIAAADYEIRIDADAAVAQTLECVFSGNSLPAQKSGKSGRKKVMREINLIEYIRRFALTQNDGEILLKITLDAGNTRNISPLLLMQAAEKAADTELPVLGIRRTALLKFDENSKLIKWF